MRSSLLTAVATLLIAAPAAHAAVPPGNLLANPGAEAGAGAAGTELVPVPNWTVEGTFTAVQYGAPDFLTTEDGVAVGGGKNFFTGGPGGALSAGTQRVNVSAAATEIDAGAVTMTLSALLGGFAGQEDSATVTATAIDAAGAAIGAATTIGPVTAVERASVTKLLPRSASAAVPAGTRSIDVRIAATRVSGNYNDGYVDNVSLSLLGAPVAGKNVNAGTVSGTVCVKRPGSSTCVPLAAAAGVPLGSTVDARKGVVEITASATSKAKFYDGIFKITQKSGITDLQLVEALAPCPKKGSAAAAAKKPKSRKLWGDGKGKFRTSGKYAAATVRGTKWLVQDDCKGTLVRVTQGVVAVSPYVKKPVITVRAGKSYRVRANR